MTDIVVLQHIACEPLGGIAEALGAAGLTHRTIRGFDGETVPHAVDGTRGLVVMGGPMGAYEEVRFPFLRDEMELIEWALNRSLPVLGVCLGSQLLATVLGGTIRSGAKAEIGWHEVTLTDEAKSDEIWSAAPSKFMGFHWHSDVFDVPPGAVSLASTEATPCQAYRHGDSAYGCLFHMEVTASMIDDWIHAFEHELAAASVHPDSITDGASRRLSQLQRIGSDVFGNWASLVRAE